MLVDTLRRHRVKALALRSQIGQPCIALNTGEHRKRKPADEHPGDSLREGPTKEVLG